MKALTAADMREVDRLTTERHGISGLQLMETAGTRAANAFAGFIRDAGLLGPPHSICVLSGKGNNGGDGFVVARHLRTGAANVFVVLFAGEEELRGDAATNFQRWREVGGEVVFVVDEAGWKSIAARVMGADVIVDAIFGTGFRGVAAGAAGRAIRDVNAKSKDATAVSPALILAVDMPSGLPSDGEAGEEPR
jgi:NAD(P)H-hydrate epimerase